MAFSGVDPRRARTLAAALDAAAAAELDGGAIKAILRRWDGDTLHVAALPGDGRWMGKTAREPRHRAHLIQNDPKTVALMASITGTASQWRKLNKGSVTSGLRQPRLVVGLDHAGCLAKLPKAGNVAEKLPVWGAEPKVPGTGFLARRVLLPVSIASGAYHMVSPPTCPGCWSPSPTPAATPRATARSPR